MSGRIKNWIKGYMSFNKIDYMSLNRLRQNQTISSTIPVTLSYAEKTRRADNLIWVRSHDTSITFDTMTLVHNPYGVTPLTALAIFYTDSPCRLSYHIHCETAQEDFHYDYRECVTSHVAPIFGLYANAKNEITLTLYREDGSEAGVRTFEWQTDKLPTDYTYPSLRDKQGNIRYLLAIPTRDGELYPITDNHFLLVNDKMRTRTGAKPMPTHIHEIDLLGRTYHTCYVGAGIQKIYQTDDERSKLIVVIPTPDGADTLLVAIERTTGAILRISGDFSTEDILQPAKLTPEHLQAIACDSLDAFVLAGEKLEKIEYSETGWLSPPALYKAASVESSGTVSLAYMKETYGLSFSIVGNNLSIDTPNDDIQEIVFSRADRLYELDLTNPPLCDSQYEKYRYTLSIPFTEMYSGTYSIVIRFRNGRQEVLQDTVTLSRERDS